MNWSIEKFAMHTKLVGTNDKGEEMVRIVARPRHEGGLFVGWTIIRLYVAEGKRGDDELTAEYIPEIMEQVKAQGWATDDDFLEYHWEDWGIEAGSLKVHIPPEDRHKVLAQRVVMRDEVDKIAIDQGKPVAEKLTDDVAAIVALKDLSKEEIARLRELGRK